MFGVTSTFVTPQTVFPLSTYMISHCSALRNASQRKVSSVGRCKNNAPKNTEVEYNKGKDIINELLSVTDSVALNKLQTIMSPDKMRDFALHGSSFIVPSRKIQLRNYSQLSSLTQERKPRFESHISFNTFEENKRGVSIQSEVNRALFKRILLSQYKLLSPLITPNIDFVREFKTRKSEERKVLRELSLGDSQIKAEIPQNKLNALLKDGMPEDVEKSLKVAFAEGYLAADPTKKEENKSRLKKFAEKFVGSILIFTILNIIIFMVVMSQIGNSSFSIRLGHKSEVMPEEINVTFEDVKGSEEAKLELEEIVDFLKHPQKYTALGAELPRGVLLVGPPGTGKTLLARAVAGEAGVPFFHASGSEFDEILVGQGAKRVRQLFATAKLKAPCVVFIDEIDSVGAKRSSSVLHPYANQTINQLLSEMDGFHKHDGVIVLGATNRRQDLDKALLRPGRFDVEVQVPVPDLKGRVEILNYYLDKVKLGKDINQTVLGRGTTGFTGADLKNIVNQAALRAAADELESISMKHLEEARDKVLMGPERKTRIMDAETNIITAFHESGHTLVAHYTKGCHPLHKVTIIPRGASLGHTASIPAKEHYHMTRLQMLATMDSLMGGRVAEEIAFGMEKVTSGASSDLKQATSIATSMVKDLGMSDKVGYRTFDEASDQLIGPGASLGDLTKEAIDAEIRRLLQESYERAKSIVKAHNNELKALADALIRYETLDAEDVKAILDGKALEKEGL